MSKSIQPIRFSGEYFSITLGEQKGVPTTAKCANYKTLKALVPRNRFKTRAAAERALKKLTLPPELQSAYVTEMMDIFF